MPTITLATSNAAATGFNMRFFDSGNIINLVTAVFGDNTTTELFYSNGVNAELTVFGTFGNFNADGDPTTGTANAFIYTQDLFGAFQTISMTGLSLDVATMFDWIFTLQSTPFHNAIFDGADTITGTAGNDIMLGYGGGDTLNGGDGDDELYGEGDVFSIYTPVGGNDILNGGNGTDLLDGGAGNDQMNGGDGADTIIASSGIDIIDGGDGIDTLTFDRSNTAVAFSLNLNTLLANGLFYDGTTVTNVENFNILAGGGADTFTITADVGSQFNINGGAGTDHLIVDFSTQSGAIVFDTFFGGIIDTGVGTVVYSGFDRLTATGGSGNDSFLGSANDDMISGGDGNDTLYGDFGNDAINGGDGDDYIDGGAGNDTINAGAGNDTIAFNTGGADQIDGGDGIDTVSLNLSSLTAGVTLTPATMGSPTGVTLSNGAVIRNVEGLGSTLFTNFDDTMIVNGIGLIGSSYVGGAGFDIFSADFSAYSTSIVFDKTLAHPIFTLSGHVPGVNADIREFEQFLITGGSAADLLEGDSGNDTLNGGGGDDTLEAHGGTNILNGGGGDDLIISGLDQFDSGPNPTDTIDGGAGNDTLRLNLSSYSQAFTFNMALIASAGGQTLANGTTVRNVERLQVEGGTGNDTFLISGTLLNGIGGQAALIGNGGIDTAIADFSALNAGVNLSFNTLSMANGSGALNVSVENFTVTGSSVGDTLSGSFGAETLNGGGGDDVLNGGGGSDALYGGDGDDIINGGEDSGDVLMGGNGNDTLTSASIGLDSNELVDGGDGIDTAIVSRTGISVDLSLQASAFATSTGVTLPDGTIIRNVEIIRFSGGSGNDTFFVDSTLTGDGHLFSGGNGDNDRLVVNLANWSGAVIMDNSVTLATSAFSITFLVDRLEVTAGSGNDRLEGSFGSDLLIGNAGDDTLFGAGGNDTLNGGAGIDTLYAGAGDDSLDGGDGADVLYGDSGNDTLIGGLGVDRAIYLHEATAATWTRNPNGSWTVNVGAEGVDTVTSVEILDFANRDVVLDNAQQTFSGDGTSDILWRRTDGLTATWAMNGTAQSGSTLLGNVGLNWSIQGTGDFSGDGRDDILWQRNDGLVYLWNNASIGSAVFVAAASTAWDIQGVGDFNFDGRDDFLWRNPTTGQVAIWTMNGSSVATQAVIGGAGADWNIQSVADFNGDGRDDILWRRDDGLLAIWNTNGAATTGSSVIGSIGAEWQITGAGDFNGDGYADILWQRNDGLMAIWEMNNTGLLAASVIGGVGPTWHVADVGDYNGDGRDDIFWRNDSGLLAVWTMNGFTVTSTGITGSVGAEWGII
ncbi:MAG: FG-GAP-like repeat-containing protein [Hyphomonadaceae bacterium]